jgi:thiol:disulfide interchange protein DsbC
LASLVAGLLLSVSAFAATPQDATITKNLKERLPNLPAIDEISKTPMDGLFEVRVNGTEIFYTDAEGNFLIQGSVFDTKARSNLTEIRTNKLTFRHCL